MRQTLRIVVLFALALGLTAQSRAQSPDVTLTGTLQGANGLPARNTLLTFTPSQTFYIVGTGTTPVTGGCGTTGIPLNFILVSDGAGGCAGSPADYNVTTPLTFTFPRSLTITAVGAGAGDGEAQFNVNLTENGTSVGAATVAYELIDNGANDNGANFRIDTVSTSDNGGSFFFTGHSQGGFGGGSFFVTAEQISPGQAGGNIGLSTSSPQQIDDSGNIGISTEAAGSISGNLTFEAIVGAGDTSGNFAFTAINSGSGDGSGNFSVDLNPEQEAGQTITNSGNINLTTASVGTAGSNLSNQNVHVNASNVISLISIGQYIRLQGTTIRMYSPSNAPGYGGFDPTNFLTGEAFNYILPRFSGTMALYTGSLTANHCVEVNATGDGFIDSGAVCGTGGGGSAFNAITSGSNTSATMVVGSGASLNFTGTGTIGATSVGGITVTGTPSTGQALIATSSSAADWQTIGSSFITSLTTTGSSGAATVSGGVLNIPNYATGGSSAFSALTTSTNTTATMTCGTGCAITISGSGTNSATAVGGIVVTGTPSIGQVLTATSTSAANWQSPAGGSSAFSALTSSTNTIAAMIVGSGASLTFSGSGTINATTLGGVALTGLCQTGGSGCPTLASTKSAVSNQFLNSYNSGTGVFTSAQPSFSNISGQAALTQLPTLSANQVLGALTATTPSGLTMPSCSTGTSALTWTTGTGFGCNSISGTSWSTISNPSGSLSLSMAANTSTFTFNASTGSADLMNFTDTTSNTGTGILAHFHTQPSSTEIPWQADANGCGWKVDATGALVSTCTGTGIAILGEGAGPSGIASTDIIYGDSTAHRAKMINNNGTATNIAGALFGTTGTITGTSLSASCDSGTVSVTGAVVGQDVAVSSTTGADVGGAFNLRASVTSTNTVTVFVCGTGTPSSLAYNVAVLQ